MKMSYITLGTNNMEKAVKFYDGLFNDTEVKKWIPDGRIVVFRGTSFMFGLAIPFDEEQATPGNGTMIGFEVDSIEEVNRQYHKGLLLGGRCEGIPEQRSKGYSAYFRDLDGNKLCFFVLDKGV